MVVPRNSAHQLALRLGDQLQLLCIARQVEAVERRVVAVTHADNEVLSAGILIQAVDLGRRDAIAHVTPHVDFCRDAKMKINVR